MENEDKNLDDYISSFFTDLAKEIAEKRNIQKGNTPFLAYLIT